MQGTPSWSPDGQWIVTGGADGNGEGLFRLRADGAGSEPILRGEALNPVWAPGLDLIAYLGAQVEASVPLLAVRSDGTSIEWPPIRIDRGGRFRFLPDGSGLVYTEGGATAQDFFLLDLRTLQPRRLTALEPGATMNSFDISPDGARIVFDRQRQNSNIVLIERDVFIAGR